MTSVISLQAIVVVLVVSGIVIGLVVLTRVFTVTRAMRQQTVKNMLRGQGKSFNASIEEEKVAARSKRRVRDLNDLDVDHIKRITKYSGDGANQTKSSISQKLFKAGYYAPRYRGYFFTFQIVSLLLGATIIGVGVWLCGGDQVFLSLATVFGVILGFCLPKVWLDRKIEAREEEIRYFLPLVIEQISIGVSSALIIGTSVSEIISTADKRDAHNPVTELFIHADKLVRSGMNLEDALMEVASVCGMSEIQHAFMFLTQCSRHGGEVSKQLQDLADSISAERNVQVQARISALPVKATGPLTFVFAGFFCMLMSGIIVRIGSAFVRSGMSG